MPTYRNSISVEYDMAEVDCNPICTLVLDIDYVYTPADREHGAEATMSGRFWLLEKAQRVKLPAPVEAWLLARVDLARYYDRVVEDAQAGIEGIRCRDAEKMEEFQDASR